MTTWTKTSEELPQEGKYVIARHNRTTWKDSDDQEGCMVVVVKMRRGISLLERAALSEDNPRRYIYRLGDEHGNNHKPYAFETFGPGTFFGQEIVEWCDIPVELDPDGQDSRVDCEEYF